MDKNKKNDKNENELVQVANERDQYKDKYLRALADYHNYQKRAIFEVSEATKNGKRQMIIKLLPFLDNLEKAEVFVKDPGLEMVKKHLKEMLEKEGLTKMDLVGHEYDPYKAEAIEIVAGDKDNMIVEVLETGYMFGDDIIRPAKVRVSKKSL